MAESSTTRPLNPRLFQNSRGAMSIYVPGDFLTIGELEEMLNDPKNRVIASNTNMKSAIAKCKSHDFQHMRVPFPVDRLQHVTEQTALWGIVDLGGFIPSGHGFERRPGFRDLSFWSAEISEDAIEEGRQRSSDNLRRVITPQDEQQFHHELQKQFAASPAFNASASRYGQYKFSFPLSQLLTWYGDQFCQGKQPQLRILGTEAYHMEIAHCIVVHGPDTVDYNDFPMVPTVQNEEDFVYWMNDTLYWRPESTSYLYVKILEDGSVIKECYNPECPHVLRFGHCPHTEDGIYAPWNHLEFAFHIPPENHLRISRQDLLENLSPCETDTPYLGKESDENPSKVIKVLKDKWSES